ncbi:MAG TPA: class I SAM-dependent methyltransferase [Terriglobales bacterium]|nr:class I SAM-dependent methyltransferase [Terriglobales bacterium]
MIHKIFQAHELQPACKAGRSQGPACDGGYYKGASGSKYFDWQNSSAAFTAHIEARKFHSYIKPSDAVLDFGCGGGHILRHISCTRRVGVDINPAARAAAIKAGLECYESIADVGDDSFNVVISHHALEHVEHPIAVLRALRRKLAPSGTLVLYLPMDDWRTQRVYDPDDVNHHLHTWTPQLLGNSLFEAGFLPHQFSIHIVGHALFPGVAAAYGKLPEPLVDKLCQVFAIVLRRRQLLAVAIK